MNVFSTPLPSLTMDDLWRAAIEAWTRGEPLLLEMMLEDQDQLPGFVRSWLVDALAGRVKRRAGRLVKRPAARVLADLERIVPGLQNLLKELHAQTEEERVFTFFREHSTMEFAERVAEAVAARRAMALKHGAATTELRLLLRLWLKARAEKSPDQRIRRTYETYYIIEKRRSKGRDGSPTDRAIAATAAALGVSAGKVSDVVHPRS